MKKVTLTLEEPLIEKLAAIARATGLKKTQIVRNALKEYFHKLERTMRKEAWLEENVEALDSYGKYIDTYGCFSEGHRNF
jgi:post-segregation antitoxin (ccd killing protein)